MITFANKRHVEFKVNDQVTLLAEFTCAADKEISNDQILETFIRSNSFVIDRLPEGVKNEPDRFYLKRAFDFEKIKISDFRKYSKEGTAKFLVDFINDPDWGDDRNDFAKLLDNYFEIHAQIETNNFYIISKDWFNIVAEKSNEPESWAFMYYFLIISIDRNSNELILTEWNYD